MSEHGGFALNLGTDVVTRNISNTEVFTWNSCRRKYWYEFILAIEPNQMGDSLRRGLLFHEVMASYYQFLKDWDLQGRPMNDMRHESAVVFAKNHMAEFVREAKTYTLEDITIITRLTTGYWNFYQGDPEWIIEEVETPYEVAVGDHNFSFRVDMIVRRRDNGMRILVDHKTAYNFWSGDDLALSGQFPKYVDALKRLGVHIDLCILNQVRSRELKNPTMDQLFKRTPQKPTHAKKQRAAKEQVVASQEIVAYRRLPLEVQEDKATRVLNKQVCKYCDVKPLCMAEFDGGDATVMMNRDFKPRTYGYNFDVDKADV